VGLRLLSLEGNEGGNGGGIGGANGGAQQAASEREQLQGIVLQIASLMQVLEAQMTILDRLETHRARDSRAMLANLCGVTRQPLVRNVAPAEAAEDAGNDNGDVQRQIIFAVALRANPRSLHVLWEEYKRLIDGCRAARLFTRDERGQVKH
jgi:hypothetical protein